MKKLTLLFLTLFISLRSFASIDSTINTISYGTVDIISNRILLPFEANNNDIQIIDKKTIEKLAVNSISELLSYCNGIDIRQRGPNGVQSDISILGGTFDQSLLLVNGIKIIDPQTGHHMMNLPIGIGSIERIEILKGAAARRYGINALVGAINIITKKDFNENATQIEISAGTNFQNDTNKKETYYSYSLGIYSQFKIKNSSNLLSVNTNNGNGYRYNTGYSSRNILFQTSQHLKKDLKYSILSGYTNNQFGANAFYAAPADKDAFEKVETFIGIAELSKAFNKFSINPKISYRYNDDNYIFIKQKPEVYENNHYSHSLSLELNTSYKIKKSVLALGLEHRNERLKSNNLGDRIRVNDGLYIEYRNAFLQNKININSGVYLNYNSLFGIRLLPGIDAGYSINKHITVYGNWGAGQRVPTFTDLYYIGPSNIGNNNLQAELSNSKELGTKLSYNNYSANLCLFSRNINNLIDWTKENTTDPWKASNINKINTNGISIENKITINADNYFRLRNISVSYTHLTTTFKNNSNTFSKYNIENLRDQLSTQFYFNLGNRINFSIAHRYQNRINYKDYQLTDMRLTYTFNKLKLNFDALNLFNVKFEEIASVPMPGRWFDFGVIYILK